MSYRSLLVLLDQDARQGQRTQLALGLAKAFDAHLLGLAPTGLVDLPAAPGAEAALGPLGEIAWDALRRQAQQSAQAFRDACIAAGAASFEVQVDEADKAVSLVRHAHGSDLCLLGQADPGAHGHRAVQAMVEQVVLYSARPTLVVPFAGKFAGCGERILVAWDDSREAARAVADALPLLHRAARVQVLSWCESSPRDESGLRAGTEALRQWLQRHGVGCEVHVESTQIDVADAMLSRAAELDSDLIVMGAYGHARWAERVLGGATRALLGSMTVPVLMSH